jgi:hypothetical protein
MLEKADNMKKADQWRLAPIRPRDLLLKMHMDCQHIAQHSLACLPAVEAPDWRGTQKVVMVLDFR